MTKLLTPFEKIWTNCRATLHILSDGIGDDWLDAKFSARNIATILGIPFDSDTATVDDVEQVILAGLKDERTFEQAVQAHEEYHQAQGLQYALITFCTEMGHEVIMDSDGDQHCQYCGVSANETGPSDTEEIWEEFDDEDDGDSYRRSLLPQPPHPLAE